MFSFLKECGGVWGVCAAWCALIGQLVEVEDGAQQHDNGENHYYAAYNLVDEQNAVVVELAPHLVYKPCKPEPPQYGSADDAYVSHAHFNGAVGHNEGELCKQENEKEDDEGVGQRHQECRYGIVHERPFAALHALVQFLCGVGAVAVYPEYEQEHASADLQKKAVALVVDEIHHETHSKTGEQGVDDVAHRCCNARNETIPTAFVKRALYAKYAHGTHRGRSHDAYKDSLENEVQYVYLNRKLHNGCKIANFMRYGQIFT